MILAGEHIGQGQEDALLGAVLVQREGGNADDIHGGVAAQDVGQDGLLVAHDAAGLDVNQDLAAGQLFQLGFEGQGHVADDGAFDGVHFRVGQGDLGQRRGAAQQHDQNQCDAKQLFHWGIPPLIFRAYRAVYVYIQSHFGEKVNGFYVYLHCKKHQIIVYCLRKDPTSLKSGRRTHGPHAAQPLRPAAGDAAGGF